MLMAHNLPDGMKTSFWSRLYPNHKQEGRLLRMIEAGR